MLKPAISQPKDQPEPSDHSPRATERVGNKSRGPYQPVSRPQRSYLSKALPKPLHEPKPHRRTAQGLPTPMPHTRSDGGAPAEVSDSDADNAEQEESEYEEVEEVEEQEVEENGDDDVEEYEEYEEEEEEVEEYEEVEEVEMEEKEEVDLSDSPIKAEEDRNDVCQDMDFEGHDELLRSGSSTVENFKVKMTSDTLAVKESNGNFKFSSPLNELLTTEKEESGLNYKDSKCIKSGKDLVTGEDNGSQEVVVDEKDTEALSVEKASKDHSKSPCGSNSHMCSKENLDAKNNFPSSITGNEMADAILMRDHSGEEANGALNSKAEIKQMEVQSLDNKKRLESRLAAPDARTRSRSPGAENKDENKPPTVICDFFAKGWCIRGSSCMFLHIKGDLDNTAEKPEADVAALNQKRKVQLDEGLGDITERSRLTGFPEPPASSVESNLIFSSHVSSETILPRELRETQRWHQFHEKYKLPLLGKEELSSRITPDPQQLPSSKDDPGFVSLFKDVGRDSQRQNWSADDYSDRASKKSRGSSTVGNGFLPEHGFSSNGSVLLSRNYHNEIFSSHSSSMEDISSIRSQSLKSDSITSHTAIGMLPSHCSSAWRAFSLPLSSSSLPLSSSSFNTSPVDAQKLLDREKECRASRSYSLLQSSSPFSGSESENLPLTNVPLHSAEHKTKFSSNDWEPSVPFRPSFFIPPMSISGSLYDPLRDSIESPKIGDQSFRVSLHSHGASIVDESHRQKYGDLVLTGTLGPERNDDITSVSSHNKFYENVLEKRCHTHKRDSITTEAETEGTSVVDWQNGTMPKEESCLGPSHGKDVKKISKINDGDASNHQNDGSKHQKDIKLSRDRQESEMDAGHKIDGDMQKESKALRHTRAALIDLVKELLKPTWRDGHLSKDAHNMIVKKAVDKVLSTIQSHQVPTTMESVKQYLSSYRPKIEKLVEGYVDKYGKS